MENDKIINIENCLTGLDDKQKERIYNIMDIIENTPNFPFSIYKCVEDCIYYKYNGKVKNKKAQYGFQGGLWADKDRSSMMFGLDDVSGQYDRIFVANLYSDNAIDRVKEAVNKVAEVEKNGSVYIGEYKSFESKVYDRTFKIEYSLCANGLAQLWYFDNKSIIDVVKQKQSYKEEIKYSEALSYLRAKHNEEVQLLMDAVKTITRSNDETDSAIVAQEVYHDIGLDINNKELTYYTVIYYSNGDKKVYTDSLQYDIDDIEDNKCGVGCID